LVLGDEDRALVEEERSEVGAVELGVGNGGAEQKAFGVGDFAELGDLGGFQGNWKSRSAEGGEGELDKISSLHGRAWPPKTEG
jgi:hypothetical protein